MSSYISSNIQTHLNLEYLGVFLRVLAVDGDQRNQDT